MHRGELRTVGVRWRSGVRDSVRYVWDALGRRDSLVYAARSGATTTGGAGDPIRVALSWDVDGRMRRLCSTHAGDSYFTATDVFKIRLVNDTIDADGLVTYLSMADGAAVGDPECLESNEQIQDRFQRNVYDLRHQLVSQVTGDSVAFRYDPSGNMTHRIRHTGTGLLVDYEVFRMPQSSNRMDRMWPDSLESPATWTDFTYDAEGGRRLEDPTNPDDVGLRNYLYDGLARQAGTGEFKCTLEWDSRDLAYIGTACHWQAADPATCRYDPQGRLLYPCGELGALGYDGANVVRTGEDDS
ncbi:MAG: hypothetical protein RQ723_12985, partial [Desulfuromonadales bacterium]|nr:hypothetical protein [Desulfuromonadales bacterium]